MALSPFFEDEPDHPFTPEFACYNCRDTGIFMVKDRDEEGNAVGEAKVVECDCKKQ